MIWAPKVLRSCQTTIVEAAPVAAVVVEAVAVAVVAVGTRTD